MSKSFANLITAVTFLTRLPVGGEPGDHDVASSLVWFPLVGAALGGVVGGVHVVLSEAVDPLVSASVAVAIGIAITGGFHEDGLGDTADGFGGGWTPEQRLEIMTDPRQGTYGVLAIVCSVVIRVAAISVLGGWVAVIVVSVSHLLSRNWAGLALLTTRAARHDGLAAEASAGAGGANAPSGARASWHAAAWAAVSALLAGVVLAPVGIAVIIGIGIAAALIVVRLAYRKVGGTTGDVLGALQQASETSMLVAAGAVPLGGQLGVAALC